MRAPSVIVFAIAACITAGGCANPAEPTNPSEPSASSQEARVEISIPTGPAPVTFVPGTDYGGNGCSLGFEPTTLEQTLSGFLTIPRTDVQDGERIYFERVCSLPVFDLFPQPSSTPAADQTSKLVATGYDYCLQHTTNPEFGNEIGSLMEGPGGLEIIDAAATSTLCSFFEQ
ncbi:hypothetical protein [Rhodococcus sp. 008]|uniref:hypothetical protein n=1 Tax=Rhodococcus sp. 008 TaxID=1723645 RepID=UPI0012EA3630|nr:hypothetical protein [Rhodococcus sp. 008]